MKKKEIYVPAHVSKISQWAGLEDLLPNGSFILNKVFPGCGMTYYYLHSDQPVILCAPRNSLLRNKAKQLEKERETNGDGKLYTLGGYEFDFFYYTPSTKTKEEERRIWSNLSVLGIFAVGSMAILYIRRGLYRKFL